MSLSPLPSPALRHLAHQDRRLYGRWWALLAATAVLTACGGGGGADPASGGGTGGGSGGGTGGGTGGGSGGGTVVLPTVSINTVSSDTLTQPGVVLAGSRTDDLTPLLSGSLSAALAEGQKLQVYDGDVALPTATTVVGQNWTWTPALDLSEGAHRFSAEVIGADGKAGTRSAVYDVTLAVARWQSISPAQGVRATPLALRLSGSAWPAQGWSVEPLDDARATCATPTGVSDTGLDVSCTFFQLGDRKVALKLNGQTVAQPSVTVSSNVSGVSWSSPSSGGFGTGTVLLGEQVQFKLSGTQLLADTDWSVNVEGCGSAPTEVGTGSATERVFACTLSASAGAGQKAGTLRFGGASGPILAAWQLPVAVPPVVAPAPKLPHSGVTSTQCYTSGGGTVLSACSSASAVALNGQQDGHRTSVNTMSFSHVGSYTLEECVKDDVSGLVWEGKTTSGLRSGATTASVAGNAGVVPPVPAISAYIANVNAIQLCGFSDWRLPTVHELQTVINFGLMLSNPALPGESSLPPTWFINQNTVNANLWTSSTDAGGTNTWVMQKDGTTYSTATAGLTLPLRLVRGSF